MREALRGAEERRLEQEEAVNEQVRKNVEMRLWMLILLCPKGRQTGTAEAISLAIIPMASMAAANNGCVLERGGIHGTIHGTMNHYVMNLNVLSVRFWPLFAL